MRNQGHPQRSGTKMDRFLALMQEGQFAEAIKIGTRLAQKSKADPELLNYLGMAHGQLGQFEQAVQRLTLATKLRPNFAWAHNNLGTTLRNLGRLDAAASAIETAISLQASYAEAHNNLGNVRVDQNDFAAAITHYEAAVAAEPTYVRAHNNLCEVLEKTNQLDAFAAALDTAQLHCPPNDPRLLLHLGKQASRDKDYAAARDHLSKIRPEQVVSDVGIAAIELLGKAYDRLGDYDKAFACFTRMNEMTIQVMGITSSTIAAYTDEVRALADSWDKAETANIPHERDPDQGADLVFLVGFPRSGTTLLDTVLRGHADITVIEEGPMAERVDAAFGQLATAEHLAALPDDSAQDLRNLYRAELERANGGTPTTALIIDKMPLNLRHAGLMHRLFPAAKFIVSLRDPADSVLSCYMQNFAVNTAMASFLSLSQSATLYDQIWRLWRAYEAALPLHSFYLKYEDLVSDMEATVTPLIAFLGLAWDDSIIEYQATARQRTNINTPSYNQVTQSLYTQAMQRWRRYDDKLAPILPLTQKWSKEWDYPV